MTFGCGPVRTQWGIDACKGLGGARKLWMWGHVDSAGQLFVRKRGQVPMRKHGDRVPGGYLAAWS